MTRARKVSQMGSQFFFVPPGAASMSYAMLGDVLPAPVWRAIAVAIVGVAITTTARA
jgi:hypothetical protein